MAFIEKNDKFHKYKYVIGEFIILYPDGTKTEIPNHRIKSVSLTHLYNQNLFPVFRTEITLSSKTYYKILKNKKDVKFKIRIQKFYTQIGSVEKSLYRDWINDTFDLILDDDDYNTEAPIIEEEKEMNYNEAKIKDDENALFEVDNVMEFFLYKSELVNKFNVEVNAILTNATVNDGIQYIATQAGINNLLMSTPENTKTYSELLIPPMQAKYALKFLDTYYGFYKSGMMLYGDMMSNIIYLLDYTPKCTAYQTNEKKETNILIPKKSNKYSSDKCTLYRSSDSEVYFVIGDNTNISLRNDSMSFNAYNSTDATVIDAYQGSNTKSNTDVTVKDKKANTFIDNFTENEWYPDIYSSMINAKNVVVEVLLSDYDAEAIAPNKTFKLVFEDSALASKYKGKLILTQASHSLVREGEEFTLTSVLNFKLIN